MALFQKWLLAGLAILPLLGACRDKPKAALGGPCASNSECQSGLSCVEGACRPTPAKAEPTEAETKCLNARSCEMSDLCVPWGDKCGWAAKSPMDCIKKRGSLEISPCQHFGRCDLKDGVCVASRDADCAKSKRCKAGGGCTAKDGICQ